MMTVRMFGHGGIKLPVFSLANGNDILTDDGMPMRLETTGEEKGPGGQTYPPRSNGTGRRKKAWCACP